MKIHETRQQIRICKNIIRRNALIVKNLKKKFYSKFTNVRLNQ